MNNNVLEPELRLINNGTFNDEVTNDMFPFYDYEQRKGAVWHFFCKLSSSWCPYRNVGLSVYKPLDPLPWRYEDITEDTVNDLFVKARQLYHAREAMFMAETEKLYVAQGKEIRMRQEELGFGGLLQMDYRRLKGYLLAIGSWNQFKADKACLIIDKLEKYVPKFHMRNNCNNGMSLHEWFTDGSYLTMKFKCLNEKELDMYMNFYKTVWQAAGLELKADSVRHELYDHGHKHFQLELIMWWD